MDTSVLEDLPTPAPSLDKSSDPARLAAEARYAVAATVAPVWPLADYVAVNPYLGLTDHSFLAAREHLRAFSDCELLMSVDYYRQRSQEGCFGEADIEGAIAELVAADVPDAESLMSMVRQQLLDHDPSEPSDIEAVDGAAVSRVRSVSASYDAATNSAWTAKIHDEISKHCGAHYDRGQAFWLSPWQDLPLYTAWRAAMRHDRRLELLGLAGLRALVANLPSDPADAIAQLLETSGLPPSTWQAYLLCLAYELPGWSAWAQYQAAWVEGGEARVGDGSGDDLNGLLAMRLAYDVALSRCFDFKMDIDKPASTSRAPTNDTLAKYVLLRANELGYRNRLLGQLSASQSAGDPPVSSGGGRQLAQVAFCIDVRSERLRRQLETANERIETIGFAGFFGLPFAYERIGESTKTNQLPVLVPPQFKVVERVRDEPADRQAALVGRRNLVRFTRKAWKRFQTASTSAFAFVEATGMLFGLKLLRRVAGDRTGSFDPSGDGFGASQRSRLGPDLGALGSQGLTLDRQADLAASILTGMGLKRDFARLVVFCGHGSQTENNPLQAGLDCGACGGHSGEPNARLAAQLLNCPHVRAALVARGIELPEDVHFLAGLHNTTTDEVRLFDLDLVPTTHHEDVEELRQATAAATIRTKSERLPLLSTTDVTDPLRRSLDWSEVRPEWGLTGNAAFIVGPRSLTTASDLAGRAFLHNYDHHTDPDGKVLEAILTAPMVVGSWINLQYYASTVDPGHFGSGSKTIHNVVGRFGALSGNGGDLTTGLPWESIHDGMRYQHDPVRLLSIVAAPRDRIDAILHRHANVERLVVNGWVHLVALDDGRFYQLTPDKAWQEIDPNCMPDRSTPSDPADAPVAA